MDQGWSFYFGQVHPSIDIGHRRPVPERRHRHRHPNVNYPRSEASIVFDVNAALTSGNRDTMLALASALDSGNNCGCPLS